ncbi:hypothetical protein ABT154_22790 [Streptomyces sp. NPDC001728]|uniref:DUF7848 domain-containing protein n=1 Tax=Streptomyces sp. NPDC001728 TaxID=3154396 RepID=UPI0033214B79
MSRVLELINWTLRPDQDDDAPAMTHHFRCLAFTDDDGTIPCGAEGDPITDLRTAQDWTFAHLRENPEHTSYVEVIERPYVMRRGGRA